MRYTAMPGGRAFVLALFSAFGVVAVVLGVTAVSQGGGPGLVIDLLWFGALGWNAYWWLTRIAVELVLENGVLRWRTPLTGGAVAVTELVEIRPMRLSSNIEVFVWRGGRPVLVPVRKGLGALLAEVTRLRPQVPVRLGWQGRLAEWVPGPSQSERDG